MPLLLEKEGLCAVVCRKLGLGSGVPDMTEWQAMVEKILGAHRRVEIALVGKYTGLHDAYLSVAESLFHAGTACDAKVDIRWVDSETLTEENAAEMLAGCGGGLVPGGFGDRGIEGMIAAARYARENRVPYLGICLGMQIAVIEFARHVAGWDDADSTEFTTRTAHPVIDLMPEQVGVTAKGGTIDSKYLDWHISKPYLVLIELNFAGLLAGFWKAFASPDPEYLTLAINMGWIVYNLMVLGATMAVAVEDVQKDKFPRVPLSLSAKATLADGSELPVEVCEFSQEGVRVLAPEARQSVV